MTKNERELVKQAVKCFSADGDDWDGGMRILFKLLKLKWPFDEAFKDAKSILITDLLNEKQPK